MATSPHYRSRDVAMPADGRTPGDERRDRGRDGRGMNSANPSSPPAVAHRFRDGARDSRKAKPRDRSRDPSQPAPRHRRRSRDRSRDGPDRPPPPSSSSRDTRDPRDTRDTRDARHPRDDHARHRDKSAKDPAAAASASAATHHPRRPHHHHPHGEKDSARDNPARLDRDSRIPSSTKRPRSPSTSLGDSQAKRSRRDASPRRPAAGEKDPHHPTTSHRRRDSRSPRGRSHSPSSRRERRPKNKNKPRGSRPLDPLRRGQTPSPPPRRLDGPPPPPSSDNPNLCPIGESRGRPRSRSPDPSRPPRSISRQRSPRPSRGGGGGGGASGGGGHHHHHHNHHHHNHHHNNNNHQHQRPPSSEAGSRRGRTPDFESRRPSHRRSPAPRSPRDHKENSRSGKKGKKHNETRGPRKPDQTSGANSVEVNMAARGGYRGAYNGHMQGGGPYSTNGQYQGPHDGRRFSQSSGHATPNPSFHGSPPTQSPFGGSQGWGGQQQQQQQQQYSPQGQYPPQFPNGPQGQYHQGHSPPYGPPTGPGSQYHYPAGPSRGGHRGGGGGFRGNHFNSNRGRGGGNGGGGSGGGKGGPWNSNSQGGSGHTTPMSTPSHTDQIPQPQDEDTPMGEGENPFRPSKDLQVEDTGKGEKTEEKQMPPPTRAPPTGPQASKFSFAFKAASKPAVTPTKAEIAQKFSAAPPRRDNSTTTTTTTTTTSTSQNEEKDRRELPRGVPTEPASSRARAEQQRHHHRSEPQRSQAPPAPRFRKVKKMVRRPKQRPELPDELASSKSVFYRKPGDESVVGSGTYGKVFKARNVYTGKLVALKKIRMDGERDGFPVTAVREIKLLQSLRHTNIVDLQEVMVEKNDCFMVFEYLSHDLTGLLNHPSFKLDAAQRKHLSKQLFEGLDYLHRRGVLHRDIKAANILVSSDGVLKLADFGLARFYAKRHQLDYTNRVITIWYRSPELLLGETQYGPAVDIWSAACVMVEIFTRHAIFPGDGGEISQLDKIFAVLGTPTKAEWPALVDMPWFELLRPSHRQSNVFAAKYQDRLTPAAFDLLAAMFRFDPAKRPTASEVLEHPYFTTEEPAPRQAVELANIDGDWHELESKALRRENERREREARRALAKEIGSSTGGGRAGGGDGGGGGRIEKDKKRPPESGDSQREAKRQHVNERPPTPPPPPPPEQDMDMAKAEPRP